MAVVIPRGKKLTFFQSTLTTINILGEGNELELLDDINIKIQSKYKSVFGDSAEEFATILSGITRDLTGKSFTGGFRQMGMQVWAGTEPLGFTANCILKMKTNARLDVFEPVKRLIQLTTPRQARQGEGIGLIPPGYSVLDATSKGLASDANAENKVGVRVGTLFDINPVVVKNVTPVFAKEVDSTGAPIYCQLTIDMESLYTITSDDILRWGSIV